MSKPSHVIQCGRCGAKNRVILNAPGKRAVCGKCRTPLAAEESVAGPSAVSDRTFQDEVMASAQPVLVDFWAPWCGPCKMVGPLLDGLAEKYAGRLKIVKLNVDENPATAARYSVSSIPTLLFFKNGRVVQTLVGAMPRARIEEQIIALL